MTTLKIDLIVVGLILTAVTSFPTTLRLANVVSVAGFCLIVLSSGLALVTNVGSDYPTGISRDYLLTARESRRLRRA
ncbi:hypothetical protein ACFOZ7_10490 [Natribaculum luteum]|uniref:Uncharacterized protein n=2 Tax=Natribaculum luteum TaxID=1586232 RepID=A0ABD5NZM3_9EURY